MLSRHGDPYTLIISQKVFCFQEYQIGSNGNLQGVGLFINMEPKTRHLVSEPHDQCLLVLTLEGDFVHVCNAQIGGNNMDHNDQFYEWERRICILLLPDRLLSCVKALEGGLAARAGIHEGVELVEINGVY
ncbi:hypothetical protein RHMOL_Rhmol03G0023100 [Rhododendron molle]|uniref:Uncharacterized protein n=1 Tax=Rhododendron molle TaxID=49168 RepID=A0ACC0PAU2_RHOML|nr:hypothetical protein RHMOL_Rhmol03G0023100 [Rhododendron molle]